MKMVKSHFMPRTFSGFVEDIFHGNAARFFKDDASQEEWLHHFNHSIPVNVKESEAGYILDVIAPGLAKEDFTLQVNDKVLTISFEQKETEQKEDGKWLRKEFKLRSFKRSFTLGEQVDVNKISASYNNGVLQLTLPKKETAIVTNKVIEIQ